MPPSADSGANEGSDGMNRKRICTACVWLAALALAACARHEPPADTVRPVQLVQVRVGVLGNPTIYAGEVKPRHEADLGFCIGGKLVACLVDAVALVNKVQPLVRIDHADVILQAVAEKAKLVSAEYGYN